MNASAEIHGSTNDLDRINTGVLKSLHNTRIKLVQTWLLIIMLEESKIFHNDLAARSYLFLFHLTARRRGSRRSALGYRIRIIFTHFSLAVGSFVTSCKLSVLVCCLNTLQTFNTLSAASSPRMAPCW